MTVPQKSPNLRLHVTKSLHQLIKNGSFKPGSRLPPERKLAEQFKVSRSSIREAIRALETIGILESQPGAGNIVLEQSPNILFHPYVVTEEMKTKEILEARRGLELEAVRLVAERVTKEQEKTLQCYIGEMRIANSEAVATAIESGFHRQIVAYSGNQLLQRYFASTMLMLKVGSTFSVCSCSKLLLEIHDELCEAMIKHRSADAETALKYYFEILIDAQN